VRCARDNGMSFSTAQLQFAAGRHGSAATLLTARQLGMDYTANLMVGAAEDNTFPVLQFLRAQGCPWDSRFSAALARRGDFEMLRWARELGCEWNTNDILNKAASSGNVEMAAWVSEQPGVVCNEESMVSAAHGGFTAMCEYLHAEQCPWHARACCAAARNGHVDTLRWLHENGCPWAIDFIVESSAIGGSVQAMAYLQHKGIDLTADMLTVMLNAAGARSKLAAAQWLRQQGAEWPAQLVYNNTRWLGDTLAWARAEGCRSPINNFGQLH
jgi:hypothetical protein